MKLLDWLLAKDALEELFIESCLPWDLSLHLPNGLAVNQSLKQLSIECVDDGFTPRPEERVEWSVSTETLEAMASLCRGNRHIESIDLACFDIPMNIMEHVTDALVGHGSLTTLKLRNIGGATGIKFGEGLARMLSSCAALKTVIIFKCHLGDSGAIAFSRGLEQNSSLKRLELSRIGVGAEGAVAIADSLRHNNNLSLEGLGLPVIGDEAASSITKALTINTTIEDVTIDHLDGAGLTLLASHLPQMTGLRKIHLCRMKGLSQQSKDSFFQALERNTELTFVWLQSYSDNHNDSLIVQEIMSKARYETALNRAGKRILKSNSHVPSSLWPLILARSSKDPNALYFFLREKPDVLINKPPASARVSRKRKRS